MSFQVQENGKPCTVEFFSVDKSWDNATFATFREAKEYADKWLGALHGPFPFSFMPGNAYCYNGHDSIAIQEIKP